jgi:peptide/nickel transport system permease protein
MRIVDTWSLVPAMMFMIAIIAITPNRTVWHMIFLLTAFGWMGRTSLLRSMALAQRNLDYVAASKTLGTRNITIIFREVMPNLVAIISANIVLTVAGNIGIETGMSLLGFGLPFGTPSIGTMIQAAINPSNLQLRWWTWAPAIIVVFLMSMSINFVGQAVSRAADAKQRLV